MVVITELDQKRVATNGSGPHAGVVVAPPQRELLRFENATLGYGKRVILRDINFTLNTGEYVAIVGSNGSGKTTFLRTLLGNLRALSGRVETPQRLHYGYVPQL